MAKKLSTSPKGTLVFPVVSGTKPDTKFKPSGVWKTGLRVKADDPQAVAFMERIDEAMATAVATARAEAPSPKEEKRVKMCADKPYSMETDDEDNETGFVIFNFKQNAVVVTKKGETINLRPALFDVGGTPMDGKETKVGGGTTARLSFEFFEFYQVKIGAGVSLRLKGVKIIKLVEWGGGDASYHGFDDEDDTDGDFGGDEDEDEAPAPKESKKKAAAKNQAKPSVEEDDDEEDDDDGEGDDDF